MTSTTADRTDEPVSFIRVFSARTMSGDSNNLGSALTMPPMALVADVRTMTLESSNMYVTRCTSTSS
jgi:hypothetical protein